MTRSILARARVAALAAACTLVLAGCNYETAGLMGLEPKAMKPLTPELVSLIEQKGMTKQSPILIRIFKEEAEVEVWKQTTAGDYELLKIYPICRWSGELGPKIKEGDRQAPEGFYAITPGLMNPRSNYYLAFNLGYPNAYDRALGRSGALLMVHGDCSSRGCYAMTDEQIGEIFALARDSFEAGQQSFQVQAYPFRMTPENLAKHRNSPHLAFWKMLKEGNDHFLLSKQEPKVDVCGKKYVFNAIPFDPARPFDAARPCPPIDQAFEVAQAVSQKRDADEREYAALREPRDRHVAGDHRPRRRHASRVRRGDRAQAHAAGRSARHRGGARAGLGARHDPSAVRGSDRFDTRRPVGDSRDGDARVQARHLRALVRRHRGQERAAGARTGRRADAAAPSADRRRAAAQAAAADARRREGQAGDPRAHAGLDADRLLRRLLVPLSV